MVGGEASTLEFAVEDDEVDLIFPRGNNLGYANEERKLAKKKRRESECFKFRFRYFRNLIRKVEDSLVYSE